MSWSVGSKGKPKEVKEAIAKQFSGSSKCPEPEETLKQKAAAFINEVIEANNSDIEVEVSAHGTQSSNYNINPPGVISNSISILVRPVSK